ncbi:hypothetical protein, partial [uncultured Ruminococcus sp.]|uniref:hypothetical protein n=1 Tax=uncultured Ruminococcus sp. TaxID=165186 RepID=UPI0026DCF9E6
FRHIAQKSLAIRQYACGIFRQSDEKFDDASVAQSLCGIALKSYINIIAQMPQKVKHIFPFFGFQI